MPKVGKKLGKKIEHEESFMGDVGVDTVDDLIFYYDKHNCEETREGLYGCIFTYKSKIALPYFIKTKMLNHNAFLRMAYIFDKEMIVKVAAKKREIVRDAEDFLVRKKAYYLLLEFAKQVREADIAKIEEVLIASNDIDKIITFSKEVKFPNINKVEDIVIATNDVNKMIDFASEAIGCHVDKFINAFIAVDDINSALTISLSENAKKQRLDLTELSKRIMATNNPMLHLKLAEIYHTYEPKKGVVTKKGINKSLEQKLKKYFIVHDSPSCFANLANIGFYDIDEINNYILGKNDNKTTIEYAKSLDKTDYVTTVVTPFDRLACTILANGNFETVEAFYEAFKPYYKRNDIGDEYIVKPMKSEVEQFFHMYLSSRFFFNMFLNCVVDPCSSRERLISRYDSPFLFYMMSSSKNIRTVLHYLSVSDYVKREELTEKDSPLILAGLYKQRKGNQETLLKSIVSRCILDTKNKLNSLSSKERKRLLELKSKWPKLTEKEVEEANRLNESIRKNVGPDAHEELANHSYFNSSANSSDYELAYNYANNSVGYDSETMSNFIAESKNPYMIYNFAKNIFLADARILSKGIAKTKGYLMMILFALNIPGADKSLIEDALLESDDLRIMREYINTVPGANIDKFKHKLNISTKDIDKEPIEEQKQPQITSVTNTMVVIKTFEDVIKEGLNISPIRNYYVEGAYITQKESEYVRIVPHLNLRNTLSVVGDGTAAINKGDVRKASEKKGQQKLKGLEGPKKINNY